jgi:galactokinase
MTAHDDSTNPGHRAAVLFVCVHNAGRSQMAAALLERHAAGRVDVRSAGSTPADEINPAVRAAMAESKSSRQRPPQTAHHRRRPHLRRALTRLVARRGQQRILRRTRQLLSWALARSPGPRCAA